MTCESHISGRAKCNWRAVFALRKDQLVCERWAEGKSIFLKGKLIGLRLCATVYGQTVSLTVGAHKKDKL